MRVLVHLNLHTYTPRQLLIRACNRGDWCSRNRLNPCERNSKASHVKAESEHRSSKRSTSAEVEVLLQDEDVSILFHYGYFNAIEFSAYSFIHLHLQCSCTFTFTFSHLADAFVQSDVQGREQSSYEQ